MNTLSNATNNNQSIIEQQAEARAKAMARAINRRYAQYSISELVEHFAVELACSSSVPRHSDVELIKTQFVTLKSVALSSGERSQIEEAEIQEARLQSLLQSYNERLKEIQRKRQVETEEAKELLSQLQSKIKAEDATFDALYSFFYETRSRIEALLLEEKSARQIEADLVELRQLFYQLPCNNVELREEDYNKHHAQKESILGLLYALQPSLKTQRQDRSTLFTLKKEWMQVGPLPTDIQDELQTRYQAECERIQAVLEILYVEERQNKLKANDRRLELISISRDAIEHVDWTEYGQVESLANTLKSYQEEWRALPLDSSTKRQELFEEFRSIMNVFFERRKSTIQRNNRHEQHIQHKEALITRMQLISNKPTDASKADVESIFEEWKRIPRTQKQTDGTLWERFNHLRHSYYESLRNINNPRAKGAQKNGAINQYTALVDKITNLSKDESRVCSREELSILQEEWKALPHIPRGEQRDRFYYLFKAQLDVLYGRLRTNERNEYYDKKFSGEGDRKQIQLELDGLRRRLKHKQSELSNVEANRERMRSLLQSNLQTSMDSIQRKLTEEVQGLQAQISKLTSLLSK